MSTKMTVALTAAVAAIVMAAELTVDYYRFHLHLLAMLLPHFCRINTTLCSIPSRCTPPRAVWISTLHWSQLGTADLPGQFCFTMSCNAHCSCALLFCCCAWTPSATFSGRPSAYSGVDEAGNTAHIGSETISTQLCSTSTHSGDASLHRALTSSP